MDIGERIRRAREEIGLSQEALGKLVGRSQSAVAEWETSESQPRRDVMQKLAAALKVDQLWLEYGRDVERSSAPVIEEYAITPGTVTESQLAAALGPLLVSYGVSKRNAPVVARSLLKALEAVQSLGPQGRTDRDYEVAGSLAARELQLASPKSK